MAFQVMKPHFVVIPFLAQGHLIPMIDIARMLAQNGVTITIFTTPLNAKRVESVISRAVYSGLLIQLIQLQFPSEESTGLPKGCECVDMLPTIDLGIKFLEALKLLEPSVEKGLGDLKPSPNCIISDMCLPWTTNLAKKFHIPRIVFHGFGNFALYISHILRISKVFDNVTSDLDQVLVPGLPHEIEVSKSEVSGLISQIDPKLKKFQDEIREAEEEAYGIVVNTFEELESDYVREYKAAKKGKKVWCIGPVSLCNKENSDKEERGSNKASIDGFQCLKWLDLYEKRSVIYACLGSLTRLSTSQMIELGLALESSNQPFIWVVKETSKEFNKWLLEENFEERVKSKGLLIHGWAPQVLILSHSSIGGFITHCGWNSTLEGICAGVPLITWPAFAEQFVNEKLVVNVLKIGVKVGVKVPVLFGHEENVGVLVDMDGISRVIEDLMSKSEEGKLRRERAEELSNLARKAVDEGGSSHTNLTRLIQDIMEKSNLENQSKIINDYI